MQVFVVVNNNTYQIASMQILFTGDSYNTIPNVDILNKYNKIQRIYRLTQHSRILF